MNTVDWSSSPTNPKLRRGSRKRPAFGCINHPKSCPHEPKCEHGEGGRHNAVDHYIVSDGRDAFILIVHTTIGCDGFTDLGCGFEFSLHTAEPINEHDIRNPLGSDECDLIETGHCFSSGWWGLLCR